MPGTDNLRQIGIESMVRESCHITLTFRAARPLGERDAQHVGAYLCVVLVGLIEISTAEQKHRIGVLRFQFLIGRQYVCHSDYKL